MARRPWLHCRSAQRPPPDPAPQPETPPHPARARAAQTPTVRAINEGTPVSLRIINDLVALSRKEELKTAPRRERYGFTDTAERINGRIAMAAIAMFGVGALPSLIDFLKTLES